MKEQNDSIERSAQRLTQAQNAVCEAARELTQIPGMRLKEGVVVELAGWRELQDALGAWRKETERFLREAGL